MPRLGRLHIPGGCYHVMGRGLERRRIFNQTEDKQDFLERLESALERSETECLAWAVMSNHYHLLIRVGAQPLSKLMSPLLGGYATSYNRRHRRSGYVFQNRYKSILCDADDYLLVLVRYIHLNPVKAGLLKSMAQLDRYPWTGHSVLLGMRQQPWQSVDEILRLFAVRRTTARQRYRAFVAQGLKEKQTPDLSGGGLIRSYGGWEGIHSMRSEHEIRVGDERILGDSHFVEDALKQDELRLKEEAALLNEGWNLESLISGVCAYCDIDERALMQKGRSNSISLAKGLICYWGTRHLKVTTHELANSLGISQPAVSQSSKRGMEYCRENGVSMKDELNINS